MNYLSSIKVACTTLHCSSRSAAVIRALVPVVFVGH